MLTVDSILRDLKAKGSEKTRATYIRHGIPADRTFGVSMADLGAIAKKIKAQQALACALFDTGNLDAMYLAGMIANGADMTTKQLQSWLDGASGMPMITGYTIPRVVAENPHARDLAMKWIASKKESVASTGWHTYSELVATQPDDALDLPEITKLLATIVTRIPTAKDDVKLAMNKFVISVGTYVKPLLPIAKATAISIGPLYVDMGDTACKVPLATAYIAKVEAMGRIGKKKTTAR